MRRVSEGEKLINVPIPEILHTDLKVRAAEKKTTLKELIVEAIRSYLYDDEPIDDEERLAIEQGRKDYAEGNAIPIEKVMEKHGL